MHLYNEPTEVQCPNCKKWWRIRNANCAVLHRGKGCCHYGDTEVLAPEDKCESLWSILARNFP